MQGSVNRWGQSKILKRVADGTNGGDFTLTPALAAAKTVVILL